MAGQRKITAGEKLRDLYGPGDPEGLLGYGPGSPDFGPRHRFFKQFGGPEFDLPPGGGKRPNEFWNLFFQLMQPPRGPAPAAPARPSSLKERTSEAQDPFAAFLSTLT